MRSYIRGNIAYIGMLLQSKNEKKEMRTIGALEIKKQSAADKMENCENDIKLKVDRV